MEMRSNTRGFEYCSDAQHRSETNSSVKFKGWAENQSTATDGELWEDYIDLFCKHCNTTCYLSIQCLTFLDTLWIHPYSLFYISAPIVIPFFPLKWSDFLYKSALSSLLTLFNLTTPLHRSFLTCSSLFLPSPFSNLSLCFSPFSWRLWLHVQNLRPIWRLKIHQIKRAWVWGVELFSIMGDCTALRAPSLLRASDSWHHQVETTAKWLAGWRLFFQLPTRAGGI